MRRSKNIYYKPASDNLERGNHSARPSAILYVWTLVSVIVPNVCLSVTEPMSTVQALANVFLPLGVYMFVMSFSRRVGMMVLWMLPLMVLGAFQIVLLYLFGRSPIAVDMFLNVVTTNTGEVAELLGNLILPIVAIVVLYIPPIVAAVVAMVKRWRLAFTFSWVSRWIACLMLSVGVAFFALGFMSSRHYRPLNDLFPVNVLYNVWLAVDRTYRTENYHKTSADYTFDAHSGRPDSLTEVYVLVIGETSRPDHWQLFGYNRMTTPRLEHKLGVVGFPKTLSQSNTTHKSVPLMMSPLEAQTFGDSIYEVKSLITAFKEAGFSTAFFSNQHRNRSFIDLFGEEADTTVFLNDDMLLGLHYDTALMPLVDQALARTLNDDTNGGKRKLLIVLHTYGSHFSYADRYPREFARFTPDGPLEVTLAHKPKLINAYDNSILVLDNLLASIMDRLERDSIPAAMIYASDHGEDLFDDSRKLFLHASPCPSFWQVHVPMVLWVSEAYNREYPDKLSAANANSLKPVSSSVAVFHTMMDLAGIKTDQYRREKSLTDYHYQVPELYYLNDHNEGVALRESGFNHHDIHLLDSLLTTPSPQVYRPWLPDSL